MTKNDHEESYIRCPYVIAVRLMDAIVRDAYLPSDVFNVPRGLCA